MSDLVYDFVFPSQALGSDVSVTDGAGDAVVVADPTLALTLDNGNAYISLSLDEALAPFSAHVTSANLGAVNAPGTVNLAASIAAVLPAGGTTGQVLAKASNADFDVEWVTLP